MITSRSLAYLDALGIDVWVRRSLAAQAAEVAVSAADVATAPDAADAGTWENAAAFSVRCFRLGSVLALIDESVWAHRRFFLDVARAMNPFKPGEREDMRFDWPQLRSSDAGMDAAGRAFRAFLDGQMTDDTRLLLCGGRVAELIGSSIDLDQHVYLDGGLSDGLAKKQLWQQIRNKR